MFVGSAVTTIPLFEFGLMTTAEVATHHGWAMATVDRWIGKGHLRAVPVGQRCYLVARSDCEGFAKPRPGPRGPRKRGPDCGGRVAGVSPAGSGGPGGRPGTAIDGSDVTCFDQTDRPTLQNPRTWGVRARRASRRG